METKLTTLAPFFEDPGRKYGIRELARVLKTNHTSVRQHLDTLQREGFLSLSREGVYSYYRLLPSKMMYGLKQYYNLEKLRASGIVEDLERAYDLPVIVLFGSYASGMDDIRSDVDICVISNVEKDFQPEKYEKKLNRKVSIHKFTKKSWVKAKQLNPGLVNSICNGLVLSGELEVV